MSAYIARRLLAVVPVALVVSVIVFALLHLAGGDPVAAMLGAEADPRLVQAVRADLGLDRPLPEQYLTWLSRVVQGDLGRSVRPTRSPVGGLIAERAPVTLELGLLALGVALLVGIPLGVAAGARRGGAADYVATNLSVLGIAVPSFLVGLGLILVFGLWLRWLPPAGWVPLAQDLGQNLRFLVLPVATLASFLAALVARVTRASVVEVMDREFVRTARAKGLGEPAVLRRHVLKAALVPVVTVVGVEIGAVLGGSVVVETVFALPGLGKLMVDAIASRDFPVVQGAVLVISLAFVLVNLAVDLLYAALDPRIRYG